MKENKHLPIILKLSCMALIALFVICAVIDLTSADAFAADMKIFYPDGNDITTTTKKMPEEGHVFVEVQGSYAEDTIQEIVDRINEIRKEACDKRLPRPRFSVSKELTYLSPSDYKPVVWSSDLQGTAQIRAAEINVLFDHSRPCGSHAPESVPFKSDKNDADSGYECIALIGYRTNVLDAINLWYQEMGPYEDLGGLCQYNSGHYLSMIDPRVECIGIATINGFTAGEFGYKLEENIRSDDVSIKGDIIQLVDVKDTLVHDYCVVNEDNIVEEVRNTVGTEFKNDIYCKIGNYITCSGFLYHKVYSGLTLSSENTKLLSIDGDGTAKALAKGSTYIDMKSANVSSKVKVNVVAIDALKPLADITVSSGASPYSKLPKTVTAVWSDGVNTDEEVAWEETVCETYKDRKGGTFTISGSVEKYGINVTQKIIVSPATVSSIETPGNLTTKNGNAPVLPKTLKVTWSNGDETFEKVTWDNPKEDDYKNAKGGTFKVNGKVQGKTVTAIYKVNPAEVISVKPKIILSRTSYEYTGKTIKPKVTVKINGKKVDKSSYTIKYPNGRKNVGSYTIKVTMKKSSGYKGTAKTRFSIIPKGTSLKKPASTKKKTVKVTWKKQTKQVTGYEIQCSNFSDFRKVSKKVNVKSAKKTTVKINKLTSGKKYYVRIRTYKTIKGKKYYSKWSNKKSVRIK